MSTPPPPPPGNQPPYPPGPPAFPPQAPPPGYGAYPQQPVQRSTNGLAVASMVLGIVGVFLCFFFLPSILALVFGGVSLNQIKQNPGQGGRGMAIAGLVLGVVVLAFMAIVLVTGSFDYEFESN